MNEPQVRQVVFLTGDLEEAERQAEARFGFPEPHRDVEGMAKIGFEHALYGFDDTYLEICKPIDMASKTAKSLEGTPGRGFMLVAQIPDLDAVLRRATDVGIEPLFVKPHHVNTVSQWHPKHFGILAEFDQMADGEDWHFTPGVYNARSTDRGTEILSMTLAVDDPSAMAQRWAEVLGLPVSEDGCGVQFGHREVQFVPVESTRGMTELVVRAADGLATEFFEYCGVRLVLQSTVDVEDVR